MFHSDGEYQQKITETVFKISRLSPTFSDLVLKHFEEKKFFKARVKPIRILFVCIYLETVQFPYIVLNIDIYEDFIVLNTFICQTYDIHYKYCFFSAKKPYKIYIFIPCIVLPIIKSTRHNSESSRKNKLP